MEFLMIGIFSLAALVFVAFPLIDRNGRASGVDDLFESGEGKTVSDLRAKKSAADYNLQELEIEHEMGKLSDLDFESLRERLLAESGQLDKEIEKHKIKGEIDELIEREVKSRRRLRDEP